MGKPTLLRFLYTKLVLVKYALNLIPIHSYNFLNDMLNQQVNSTAFYYTKILAAEKVGKQPEQSDAAAVMPAVTQL